MRVRPSRAPSGSTVLLALLALGVGACSEPGLPPVPASAPRSPTPAPAPAEAGLGAIEAQLYASVNDYRASAGLPGYSYDRRVASLARSHSQAMASGAVPMGHDGMTGRLAAIQGMMSVSNLAENVAKNRGGSGEVAGKVVSDWIGSAVHRKNLSGRHRVTGIGVARAGDGTFYVTQLYVQVR